MSNKGRRANEAFGIPSDPLREKEITESNSNGEDPLEKYRRPQRQPKFTDTHTQIGVWLPQELARQLDEFVRNQKRRGNTGVSKSGVVSDALNLFFGSVSKGR